MSDTVNTGTPVSTPSSTETSQTNTQSTENTSNNPATVQAADAQATLNDPNASKKAKVEAKKMLKQLTLKVDGEEFIEDLPFEIPDDPKAIEYMRRELQLGKMGQKRAQHATNIEKDVREFLDLLKSDPIAALSDKNIGVDVKQLAEKVMLREIENAKKSPEQKALEEAQQELKELREKQDKDSKQRNEEEQQRLTQKIAEDYDTQITNALETKKIPKTPAAVKKVLDYAQLAVAANKNVSIEEIIPFIQEELVTDYRTHASSLSDEQLLEFMGKEIQERMRKLAVARVKKGATNNPAVQAPTKVANTGKATEVKKEEAPKMSYKQFFKV